MGMLSAVYERRIGTLLRKRAGALARLCAAAVAKNHVAR